MENAVKYTPEGGRVSVTAEQWEMYTKIEIADTGIGVSETHINDIFKRFYREPKVHSTPGIGVGLYLAREIIGKEPVSYTHLDVYKRQLQALRRS